MAFIYNCTAFTVALFFLQIICLQIHLFMCYSICHIIWCSLLRYIDDTKVGTLRCVTNKLPSSKQTESMLFDGYQLISMISSICNFIIFFISRPTSASWFICICNSNDTNYIIESMYTFIWLCMYAGTNYTKRTVQTTFENNNNLPPFYET